MRSSNMNLYQAKHDQALNPFYQGRHVILKYNFNFLRGRPNVELFHQGGHVIIKIDFLIKGYLGATYHNALGNHKQSQPLLSLTKCFQGCLYPFLEHSSMHLKGTLSLLPCIIKTFFKGLYLPLQWACGYNHMLSHLVRVMLEIYTIREPLWSCILLSYTR